MTEPVLSLVLSVVALIVGMTACVIAVAASRGRRSSLLLMRKVMEELQMMRDRQEAELARVPPSDPSVGPSSAAGGEDRQSEEAQLRELTEFIEARQPSRFVGEQGAESAELVQQLKQLEHWLRTRRAPEVRQDD